MKGVLIILCWMSWVTLFAQDYVISRPQKISSKITEFEFIGKTDEGLLVHKFGPRVNMIEAFDLEDLSLKWYRDLELRGKRTRIVEIVEHKNELVLVYWYQEKRVVRLFAQKLNSQLKVVKNEVLLDEFKRGLGDPNFEYSLEHDKTRKYFVIQKKIKDTLGDDSAACIFMNENLKKIGTKVFPIEENERYIESFIQEDGSYCFVKGKVKRSFFSDGDLFNTVSIIKYNPTANTTQETKLSHDTYLFNGFRSEWDTLNDRLVIGGFYSERQESEVNGYFYIFVDFAKEEPTIKKIFTPFSKEILKKMAKKGLFGGTQEHDYLQYVEIRKLILRSDGGAILIGESHSKVSPNNDLRPSVFDSRLGSRGQVMVQYFYDDVLLISIDPNGEMDWGEILKKQQYSENDRGYFSSIGFVNTRASIHLLFNETLSKNAALNDFRIDKDGDYRIRNIFNANEFKLNLAPRYAQQLSATEVIMPAFNQRNEFLLVKFVY